MPNFQPVRLAYNTHEPVGEADDNLVPIIFLHGLTACKEVWGDIPQIVANATRRRSYSIDARNHGDSEWSDDFNFEMNVDDLINFLDRLGIAKAILVGHSMGGVTAIKTALKRPDRVEKIVVEDMYVRKCPKQVSDTVFTYVTLSQKAIENIPVEMNEAEAKQFVLRYLHTNSPPELARLRDRTKNLEPEAAASIVALKRDSNGRYVHKNNLKALAKATSQHETLYSEAEGQFGGSACFIYGTLSPLLVGADEYHIKQFFPKAVFEGLEADHSVHTSKPLEFTDALLKFLS